MMIIGCDFHPSWQQVSWLDMETGETGERKLLHGDGEAERFYRQVALPRQGRLIPKLGFIITSQALIKSTRIVRAVSKSSLHRPLSPVPLEPSSNYFSCSAITAILFAR